MKYNPASSSTSSPYFFSFPPSLPLSTFHSFFSFCHFLLLSISAAHSALRPLTRTFPPDCVFFDLGLFLLRHISVGAERPGAALMVSSYFGCRHLLLLLLLLLSSYPFPSSGFLSLGNLQNRSWRRAGSHLDHVMSPLHDCPCHGADSLNVTWLRPFFRMHDYKSSRSGVGPRWCTLPAGAECLSSVEGVAVFSEWWCGSYSVFTLMQTHKAN